MQWENGTNGTRIGSRKCWEPSKEDDDNIMVSSAMTSWTNPTNRNTSMCMVHGVRVKKEIRISEGEIYHIRAYLIA